MPDVLPRKGTVQVDFAEPDWERHWSNEHQRWYFWDPATDRSSWQSPLGTGAANVNHWDIPDEDARPRENKALSTMTDPSSIEEEELNDVI